MSETNAKVRIVPVWFYLGTALFVTSFFPPAVREDHSGATAYLGWQCAVITFKAFPKWIFLPFLVNPLAVVFSWRRCLTLSGGFGSGWRLLR
jgi:hypothetical protein